MKKQPIKNELFVEIEALMKKNVDAEVRFDPGGRALYTTDGSNYRYVPIGVVVPRSIEAVVEAVKICNRFDVPLLVRGGGTALAGQSCNEAVIIDFSKYLNKLIAIDPQAKTATVQPGLILDDLRNTAREKHTLTFGPDPATHNHCTLGGMLGNNSCGIHSVMAGRTVDNVREMEVLTYDGIRMRIGTMTDAELEAAIAEEGRPGEIYEGLKRIRDTYVDRIRQQYPKIPRRVSGYNLDELLPENGFNLARALVGSENTCVTILEATLDLVHSPPGRALLVLGYPSVYDAAAHINEIMRHKPLGLEGIDDLLVDFMKKKQLHVKDLRYLPDGQGWLLAEFGGENRDEALDNARKAMDAIKKEPNPPSMKLYSDEKEEERIWEIRESGLGATANVPGMPLAWPGWEDSAVHPDSLSDYLHGLRGLFDKYGYQAALYGHFGQACVHCRITFDLFTKKGIQAYRSFIDDASDLVIKYGGSFSGEHGDGQSRAMLLPKMFGPDIVEAFNQFKRLWDPRWKMNPGKVVKPNPITAGLRLGTHYNPWRPPTHFKFTDDEGSMARATLRCVGVGKCRRTKNAFMCPSFLITREEEHTTRGRARMLFELFQRDIIGVRGWNAGAVRRALDLCLACKGCKKECPVNVDMATYKSEFLSHYYRFPRLRPRHAYLLGLIGYLAPIGAKMPGVVNFITQTPVLRNIVKAIGGITQKRPLPKLARQSFTDWYAERKGCGSPEEGKGVILFPDTFNNYFYPDTLRAAMAVLERWGYTVRIPHGRIPAVRPLIHYGMLHCAKWELNNIIVMLRQEIRNDIPIVFLEPSTAAVFRDELPQLLPLDRDARRLTGNSLLFSEFIEQENPPLPRVGKKAVLHGHCHEKSVLNMNAMRAVLRSMDIDFTEPQEGCCGMAGSFGFEAKHYHVSNKIGELHLLPAVRQAGRETLIIADGFSCRTQIMDGTKKTAQHCAEVIADALNLSYKH